MAIGCCPTSAMPRARARFSAAWPRLATLGFDERFRRMWLYYLIYCAAGFRLGTIDVGHYRLAKPGAAP